MKNKSQVGGDNSTNYQAENINQYGLSYADVKEIAIDTVKQNLQILGENAMSIMMDRAQKFIDEYIEERNSVREQKLLEKFANPIFQKILFDSQKQYALEGDNILKSNLYVALDNLLDNSNSNLTNRLVEDAVNILPKLSLNHLVYLSSIYMLQDYPKMDFSSREDFYEYFNKTSIKLPLSINLSELDIAHTIYCGCVYTPTIMGGSDKLSEIFYKRYSSLFIRDDFNSRYPQELQNIFDRYSFVSNKLKISFIFDGLLSMKRQFRDDEIDYSERSKFEEWYVSSYIKDKSTVEVLVKENFVRYYEMNELFMTLNKKIVKLTSLGAFIAELYMKKLGIEFKSVLK